MKTALSETGLPKLLSLPPSAWIGAPCARPRATRSPMPGRAGRVSSIVQASAKWHLRHSGACRLARTFQQHQWRARRRSPGARRTGLTARVRWWCFRGGGGSVAAEVVERISVAMMTIYGTVVRAHA